MKMRNSRPTTTKKFTKRRRRRRHCMEKECREISTCCWALSGLSRLLEEEEIERDPGHVTQTSPSRSYGTRFSSFFYFSSVCDANNVCRSRLGGYSINVSALVQLMNGKTFFFFGIPSVVVVQQRSGIVYDGCRNRRPSDRSIGQPSLHSLLTSLSFLISQLHRRLGFFL